MLPNYFHNWLIKKHIDKSHKVLCAVSGGIDSMVLLDLFMQAEFQFEVVHINYGLRDEDSIQDQKLVEEICKKNDIPIHIIKVDKPQNVNVQEWARDQRFSFFQDLKKKFNFNYVALAHHDEDQLETILLSMFKGYSLQTIEDKRDYFIRPLIGLDKELINQYAPANGIEYRLDKSNLSSSYDRNFLRNEIIPSLKNRIPNFKKRVLKFAERQKKDNQLLDKLINQSVNDFVSKESNNIGSSYYQKINLEILQIDNGKDILFKFLKNNYQFNEDQIHNLFNSKKPEAEILTDKFVAQKNLKYLYLTLLDQVDYHATINQTDLPFIKNKLYLDLKENHEIDMNNSFLAVDYDKLQFPLSLRKAINSEDFHAFGLKGAKTELGKFMKKSRKPRYFRSLDYILIDAKKRIIIPGLEIDHRLCVDNNTKSCLIIDFKDKTDPILAQSYQD